MFFSEFVSGSLAVISTFALMEIFRTYTVDTFVVNSYQRRLKPHK